MRILAIDYGKKRIGLSISDSNGKIALAMDTYLSKSFITDIDYVKELSLVRGVELFVLGLPLNMDGSEGKRAQLTRKFGRILQKATGLPVEYMDERLTSVEAEDIIGITGRAAKADKAEVDRIAAMLILQAYLYKQNK